MQVASKVSCNLLSSRDYHDSFLHAKLHKKKGMLANSITLAKLVEHVEALAAARRHKAIFAVIYGNYFMFKETLKSLELPAKIAVMKKLKQSKKDQ